MFLFHLLHPLMLWETPEVGGGGATTGVQPGGQGVQQQSGSDFWSMFPNVPEEHRPLLQPHLRDMQGEITRLQQSQAPLRPILEGGYDAQKLQGLVNYDQRFQQDPMSVWRDMTEMLQKQGIIHEDLDLETLHAIASGQDVTEDPTVEVGQLPPEVAAYVQRLESRLNDLEGGIQQERTQRQEAVQDGLLKQQTAKMRETLKQAGYSDEMLGDEVLNAHILVHRGNIGAATKSLVDLRTGVLKGFTENKQPRELETRNGGPQPRQGETVRTRDSGDPFAKARPAAMSRLRRANRDEAQG